MSLDHFHWIVAVGQFSGQIQKFPGKKDSFYSFRRGDGQLYLSARGVHSSLVLRGKTLVQGYQALLKSSDGMTPSLPPGLIGTTTCYELLDKVVLALADRRTPSGFSEMRGTMRALVTGTQRVMDGCIPPVTLCQEGSRFFSPDDAAVFFKAANEELLKLYDCATSKHRSRKEAWRKDQDSEISFGTYSKDPGGLFEVYSMGSLVIVRIDGAEGLLTPEHFKKFSRALITFRNLSILIRDITSREPGSGIDLMRLICRLGVKDQSHVGAGFRVLRAYVMAMASDCTTALSNPRTDVLASFEGRKLEFGMEIIDAVTSITDSYSELTQLGGLYKYVISPDISMSDCFEAAYGMKEPNHPLSSAQNSFRGLLRKRVFLNLARSKHLVHAISPDEGLNDELNKPAPDTSKLERVPLGKWSGVTFSKLKTAEKYKEVDLRTNDKSSANDLQTPPLNEYNGYNLDWLSGHSLKEAPTSSPTKSNDVLHALKTGERSTPLDGFLRFKALVREHNAMEAQLMRSGGYATRYQIPSSDLSRAILSDPSLYYTVNTEPKEGEYHKPAGRLFYMATRDMKAYISSVERLCRTIFHGQVGNSIVSSYSRREEQLRSMARSTSSKAQSFSPYFVSFDMSEFSKKFPMELVNEIGEVFAELTGDIELSRLDVIFRAGVVCHSTRGYDGLFSGVKGGFEGFLNFVWTAAHVTIMELALLSTQKQGLVMAYSDDGLLEFVVDTYLPFEDRRNIVAQIQKTYANLGLSFHLFKTLVSTNVFEYLGLVAVDGRYVDTWGKALSNLGMRDQRAAFTPFSDIIDTYVGQARSAVDALCPVDLVYYHMLLDIVTVVRRWTTRLTLEQIVAVLYLPRTMGGLGVPGQMDMSITSERLSLEGFIHQALMLSQSGNSSINHAINIAIDAQSPEEEQKLAMAKGQVYSSDLPRLQGQSICQRLAEIIASKAGMAEVPDPLTPLLCDHLISLTKTLENFPLPLFSRLVSSSPDFQSYSRRLEMASSRGAFNFLGRKEIRIAQKRDSNSVKALFSFWAKSFSQHDIDGGSYTLPALNLFRLVNSNLRSCGFAPMKLRPETLLTLTLSPEKPLVYGCVDLDVPVLVGDARSVKKVDDAVYPAPNMTSGVADTTPVFDTTENLSKSLPDRMLKVIGRLITICPESLENIYAMTSALGATLPTIPVGIRGDLSRIRALMKGKPSVVVKVPQTLYALSTVEYMREFNAAVILGKVTDHSTTLMTCRTLTALFSYRMGDLSSQPSQLSRKVWFSLRPGFTIEDLAYEPSVRVVRRPPQGMVLRPPREDAHWTSQSVMVLMEEMKKRASVIGTEKESIESRRHLSYALSQRLARRVYLKINKLPRSVIVDERLSTDDDYINSEVLRLSFLEVSRMMLYGTDTSATPTDQDKDDYLNRLNTISDEVPYFMYEPEFHNMLYNGTFEAYVQQSKISTLISKGRRKAVLTDPLMSPQSYRSLLSGSIKEMYAALYEESEGLDWGGLLEAGNSGTPSLVPSERGNFNVDMVLDGLTAMLSSIRPSSHRVKPYNQVTFLIHYMKLIIISKRIFSSMPQMSRESAHILVASYTLTQDERAMLRGLMPNDLGPDHTLMVSSELGSICAKRASIYARWRKKDPPSQIREGEVASWLREALSDARALQHFLNGVISHYLTYSVAHIPTQVLRSTEAEHVLTGLWHMRRLYMSSPSVVPMSEGLPPKDGTSCLASQMRILMQRTSKNDVPISAELSLGSDRPATFGEIKLFSKFNVDVYDPLDTSELPSEVNYTNYPGSLAHSIGEYYYFYYSKLRASTLIAVLSRLSTLGEVVADLAVHGGRNVLLGVIFTTSPPVNAGSPTSSHASSSDDENDTIASDLKDEDVQILLSTPLSTASSRRLCEAGHRPMDNDPLDINPPILLARSTGVGLARQGLWEGSLVPGEPGIVAATIVSHVVAKPKNVVMGAALGWASIKLPKSSPPRDIRAKAEDIILEWNARIRSSPRSLRFYVTLGIHTEIAEIATWLQHQSFQLPVTEEVPDELLRESSMDMKSLEPSAGRSMLTKFTTLKLSLEYIRRKAKSYDSFTQMASSILEERREREKVSKAVEQDTGEVSSIGSSVDDFLDILGWEKESVAEGGSLGEEGDEWMGAFDENF